MGMNFFEQELRKIVEPVYPNATYVGHFCFVPLGANNRAKINFATSVQAAHYDTLQLKIINKNDGEVDCVRLHLTELLGAVRTDNASVRLHGAYIWQDGSDVSWYGYHPTKADYAALTNTVQSYTELFQEQVQTQTQGMTMQQSM